jgi:hypothetical protein
MANTENRGTSRATRTYAITLPWGIVTKTIPQGYIPEQGGGEIARLRLLFPGMVGAFIVRHPRRQPTA